MSTLLSRVLTWWIVPLTVFAAYLLRTVSGAAGGYIRPPGAAPEDDFLALCLRCGQCAQACPHQAIRILGPEAGAAAGTPALTDLRHHPCRLCTEHCTSVCPNNSLRKIEGREARMGLARIDLERCRAWQNDECRICYMSCPLYQEALVLIDYKKTQVVAAKCTGCGICEHVCILHSAATTVHPRRATS